MNQPNNPDEGGQPDTGWQSDQGQPIQPAGSTPDPTSQGPYGAGQTPADNQGYPGEPGTYPSYQNESGYRQQPSPEQPDPTQPDYQGQQTIGTPQSGAAQPTPAQPSYPGQQTPGTPQPGTAQPAYQPTPAQPAYEGQAYGQQEQPYQGQPYGQPAGYPQNAYQEPLYPQPGVGPQIPQSPAYPVGAGYAYTGEPPINAPWYGIDFVNASKRFFLKYATFSGRASRGEYWWACLMEFLVLVAIGILRLLLGSFGSILMTLVLLALLVPNIAVTVRRLHDSNMSGLWCLLLLGTTFVGTTLLTLGAAAYISSLFGSSMSYVPLILSGGVIGLGGLIAVIVFMLRPSNPKGARFDRSY